MYIKDMISGKVRKYGTSEHDSLRVSPCGRYLTYENLQNGDGSLVGDYRFCSEDGTVPEDAETPEEAVGTYFNIGGFDEAKKEQRYQQKKRLAELAKKIIDDERYEDDGK